LGTAGSAQAAPLTEKEKREMLWFAQRVRELQEATFRRDESPSNSAAATRASQRSKRWDRLRAGLDLILDQRGADMAESPAAPAGCWRATTRARKPIG
jgi:hypothetical protein